MWLWFEYRAVVWFPIVFCVNDALLSSGKGKLLQCRKDRQRHMSILMHSGFLHHRSGIVLKWTLTTTPRLQKQRLKDRKIETISPTQRQKLCKEPLSGEIWEALAFWQRSCSAVVSQENWKQHLITCLWMLLMSCECLSMCHVFGVALVWSDPVMFLALIIFWVVVTTCVGARVAKHVPSMWRCVLIKILCACEDACWNQLCVWAVDRIDRCSWLKSHVANRVIRRPCHPVHHGDQSACTRSAHTPCTQMNLGWKDSAAKSAGFSITLACGT